MSSLDDVFDDVLQPSDPEPKLEDDTAIQEDVTIEEKPASSDGEEPPEDDGMDLFGEDEVAEEVKHETTALSPASSEPLDGISSPERKHREAMEYAEDDEPEQTMEESKLVALANIPNIPMPKSSDGNHWVIRIPNFIKVDSKPFHPDTYIGPEQEDEDDQSGESLREKSMSIKLKVENTVRWRWVKGPDGQDRRQSNSRVIKWSDGSLSLQLGKELFDITQTRDTSGSVSRQSVGGSQQAPAAPAPSTTKAQGLTYLVAQHKRAEILQCEAVVAGYMSLRPTGMQSETHRMLVRAVGQKHTKVARLRMAPDPTTDPEREKIELMKQASKKQSRRARGEDDGMGTGRRKRSTYANRKRSGDDMWTDDEEEEGFGGASEDEYGQAGPGGRGAKRRKSDEHDTRRGPGEYQNDDFVVADSDEEDGEFGEFDTDRKKKHRATREEDAEEDDLDKLEAKIEAEQRKRKQETGAKSSDKEEKVADEDAMEVESEDDDEWGVRRVGAASGSRRKRAVDFDEEEEEE